ncbi:MAG: toxic anion resistance protein [Lachnospiraceae bacterium]|nr:toxic anion resistance protein [Lachnospiraceae bacterium]
MGKIDLNDKLSIINYGVGIQHKLADLNEVVSEIVRDKDYSNITGLYDALTKLMSANDDKTPFYTESAIRGIREELLKNRVELLKECKLYEELRNTNNVYLTELSAEITEAQEILSQIPGGKRMTSKSMLWNRIQEMKTTKTVAGTLNDQLALYHKNSAALAEKIGSAINTLMPLWESGVSLSVNKKSTQKAFNMLKALLKESVNAI